MAELITIDKDALIRAIYSSTDAGEVDARTIIDSVTAPPPAGAQQADSDERFEAFFFGSFRVSGFTVGGHPVSAENARHIWDAALTLAAPAAAEQILDALCTVCGVPETQHGSYPTCASHPFTPDENCRHVIGARCLGAECNSNGCVRGSKAAPKGEESYHG